MPLRPRAQPWRHRKEPRAAEGVAAEHEHLEAGQRAPAEGGAEGRGARLAGMAVAAEVEGRQRRERPAAEALRQRLHALGAEPVAGEAEPLEPRQPVGGDEVGQRGAVGDGEALPAPAQLPRLA